MDFNEFVMSYLCLTEADGPVRVGVDPSHYSRVRFMNIGG